MSYVPVAITAGVSVTLTTTSSSTTVTTSANTGGLPKMTANAQWIAGGAVVAAAMAAL